MEAPNTTTQDTAVEAPAATAVGPNVLRVGDSFICSGIEPMSIPGRNKHLRDVLVRLPVQFIGPPTVTAICDAEDPPASAGIPYPVYGTTVVPQGDTHTLVRISAANNTPGQQIDGLFLCHYVVIGKAKT